MPNFSEADAAVSSLNGSIQNLLSNEQYAKDVGSWVRNTYEAEKTNAIKPSKQYIQGSIEAVSEHLNNVATQVNTLMDQQFVFLDELSKQVNEMGNRIRVARELHGHQKHLAAHKDRPVHRGTQKIKADPSTFPKTLVKFDPRFVRFDGTFDDHTINRFSNDETLQKQRTLRSVARGANRSESETGLVSGQLPFSAKTTPGPPPGISIPGSPPSLSNKRVQSIQEEPAVFPGPPPSVASFPGPPPSIGRSSISAPPPIASPPSISKPSFGGPPAPPPMSGPPPIPTKPIEESKSDPPVRDTSGSGSLLEAIRQGAKLKKTSLSESKEEKPKPSKEPLTMAEEIAAKLKARGMRG